MDRVPTTTMTTTTSKPTIHSVTLPCGRIETRTSHRTYTHCVVVINDSKMYLRRIAEYTLYKKHCTDVTRAEIWQKHIDEETTKMNNGVVSYHIMGWSQSAANAAKMAKKGDSNKIILECTRG